MTTCTRCHTAPALVKRANQRLCARCLRRDFAPPTLDAHAVAAAERSGALSAEEASAMRRQALCVESGRLWERYVATWGRV